MRKRNLIFAALTGICLCSGAQSTNEFVNGYYILCEGNYGTDPGLLNFYSSASDRMIYDVYGSANNGLTLGMTGEFAALGDGRIVISSKQSTGDDSPRLVIADSKTLEPVATYLTLGAGGDGRSVAIDATTHRAYVGSTKGLSWYDTTDGSLLGSLDLSSEMKDMGDMVLSNNKLYIATSKNKLLVVNTVGQSPSLVGSVEIKGLASVFAMPSGQIYATVNTCTWGSPKATDTEQFVPVSGLETSEPINLPLSGQNNWFTPAPCQPVALAGENAVIYSNAALSNTICKYDFDTKTFTPDFITFDNGQSIYAHPINVDPITGDIIVATFEGYSSTAYWLNTYDSTTGAEKKSVKWENEKYWFPCQIVIAERESQTGIGTIGGKQVAKVQYYNLAGIVSDSPHDGINIVKTTYTDGTTATAKCLKK